MVKGNKIAGPRHIPRIIHPTCLIVSECAVWCSAYVYIVTIVYFAFYVYILIIVCIAFYVYIVTIVYTAFYVYTVTIVCIVLNVSIVFWLHTWVVGMSDLL